MAADQETDRGAQCTTEQQAELKVGLLTVLCRNMELLWIGRTTSYAVSGAPPER
jgi:hypothetical protein